MILGQIVCGLWSPDYPPDKSRGPPFPPLHQVHTAEQTWLSWYSHDTRYVSAPPIFKNVPFTVFWDSAAVEDYRQQVLNAILNSSFFVSILHRPATVMQLYESRDGTRADMTGTFLCEKPQFFCLLKHRYLTLPLFFLSLWQETSRFPEWWRPSEQTQVRVRDVHLWQHGSRFRHTDFHRKKQCTKLHSSSGQT